LATKVVAGKGTTRMGIFYIIGVLVVVLAGLG
jgi:hypothetical protein